MAGAETYAFGECTYYVASVVSYVAGGWGNATDWPAHAAASGLVLGELPELGAVVAYAAGDGYSEFGHVAWVRAVYGPDSFLVSEMNYIGWDQVDQRVSNRYDVEAFILPPAGWQDPGGGSVSTGGTGTAGGVAEAWVWAAGVISDTWPAWSQFLASQIPAVRGF